MIIQEALNKWASVLENEASPMLASELLMAHVLGKSREYVLAHGDNMLDGGVFEAFEGLMTQAVKGRPIAYLINSKEFFGFEFFVDERVLIPRPETELLVENVIALVNEHYDGDAKIVDLGTGSGNIAISLAKNLPSSTLLALDISDDALELARLNAEKLGVCGSVSFQKSDLLEDMGGENFDVIVANLPYIGNKTFNFVSEATLAYEPHSALFAGDDGLGLYKKMFQQLCVQKRDLRFVIGEFGYSQSDAIAALLSQFFDRRWRIERDLAGIDRYFVVDLQS